MTTKNKDPQNPNQEQRNQQTQTRMMKKSDLPSTNQSPLKNIWANNLGKALIISGGSVLFLLSLGGLFRLLAWVRLGYQNYKDIGPQALPPHKPND